MKRYNIYKNSRTILLTALSLALGLLSCKKYLDVVPDNIATIDNAFKLRVEAEKYLFTCYSYLSKNGDGWYNAGLTSADEIWYPQDDQNHWHAAFRIALGQQNASEPLFNEWQGVDKGGADNTTYDYQKIWAAIRDCNTFLSNVGDLNKVPDLTLTERQRWLAEVTFLKAYYHFYMLRMYGAIPLITENIAIDAELENTTRKRIPFDSCVNYISNLLDTAVVNLPAKILDENNELGRITQPIALAIKARLWILAASPLFNGNSEYASIKDKDNIALYNASYDANKWVKARDAALAAIQAAESNGFKLYEYTNDVYNLSSTTKTQLNIRGSMTERWASEHVWGNSISYFVNSSLCMPPPERSANSDRFALQGVWAPPIKIAKLFYTKNGVPIDEDKTLSFTTYDELRTATLQDRYYIEPTMVTARLNFDREPRFYADLGFDGGIWYMKDGNSSGSGIDTNTYYLKARNAEKAGFGHYTNWSETGYFVKKLVNYQSTTNGTASPTWKTYPWPEVRMADLYLLYAEAQNEVEPASAQSILYLDKVRARAGLKGIVESWTSYSSNPTKYTSQTGLRKIIHRERTIELMFEGQRFWDLRRWKEAPDELNKNITGWNISGKTAETYYKERTIYSQQFISPRDYLWPIGNYDIRRNDKLVENPGW